MNTNTIYLLVDTAVALFVIYIILLFVYRAQLSVHITGRDLLISNLYTGLLVGSAVAFILNSTTILIFTTVILILLTLVYGIRRFFKLMKRLVKEVG
jgi:hypothetical protein